MVAFSLNPQEMLKTLCYKSKKNKMYYHFKIPNNNLDHGLQVLGNDADVMNLVRGKCPNSVGPNASGLNSPNKGKLKQVNGKWVKSTTVETSCSRPGINKVDGIRIKVVPGQLLTAVRIDANHGDDLDLNPMSNFTFISDRQKCIIPAIAQVFPTVEHRFCVRHIYENFKAQWKCNQFKELVWKCAAATTVPYFYKQMGKLKNLDEGAYEYLQKIPPQHWSRSHFSELDNEWYRRHLYEMYEQLNPHQIQDIATEISSHEQLIILQDEFAGIKAELVLTQKNARVLHVPCLSNSKVFFSFMLAILSNLHGADNSSSNADPIPSATLVVSLVSIPGNSSKFEKEGYTVTTLIDGDKFTLNPNAVGSSFSNDDDVIVLDSVKSSVYTVSFIGGDQVSEIKKLSGSANGEAGYKDGDLGSAEFNKPKSFAIDRKNNIYIADKSNHVIRKISKS
nr:transposase, mutator type [Tanacetum cinerariifolium]